jgi:hypothetical protein
MNPRLLAIKERDIENLVYKGPGVYCLYQTTPYLPGGE